MLCVSSLIITLTFMAAYFNGFSCVGLETEKLDKKKGHVPTNNENTDIKSLLYPWTLFENRLKFDFNKN